MSVLLDTNILTRSVQPAHPMQKTALDAVSILKTRGEDLCIVPQNLIEFWTVGNAPAEREWSGDDNRPGPS